jgi:predicted ATP-dependent endonuclease of OLD family
MRLKSLTIGQYKNLKDFSLSFDGGSFIDVFVGKNGSGKSNLFEALIEIFRHLDQFGRANNEITFDYKLTYEIDGQETEVEWKAGKLRINQDDDRKTLGKTPFPDNVLIYYSGHNTTVSQLITRYEDAFRGLIKGANLGDTRRFIGIGPEYKSLLLAMLLVQPEDKWQELFQQFDNLKTLGMLDGISVPLRLTSGGEGNITHFSDGQFQSVYIYSIIELFKDRHCLTLLDEPDAFLHPEWQFGFLTQIIDITSTDTDNHILMSSHSASTLCTLEEQSIRLFLIENSKVACSKRSKKEVINELSNSLIQYSEDESKLLIDNVVRSSSRPILFVEGIQSKK